MGFKSMKSRLITIILAVAILAAGGNEIFSIYNSVRSNQQQTTQYGAMLEQNVENQLRYETELAVSVIEEVHAKQLAGEMTEEEAKKEAADRVRELRYNDGSGYFWVDTYEGINVVLLGRDTEGQSRIDAVDPNGTYYIKEMIANGRQAGGGFTDLMFAKPNETEPLPKRNYTVAYEPYEWVLGTGVWIDELDALQAEYKESSTKALYSGIISSIVFLAILLVLLIIFALYVGGRIAKPIVDVTRELQKMAKGDFTQNQENSGLKKYSSRRDEIGHMSGAMASLHETMRRLMQQISNTTQEVASSSQMLKESADQSAEASEMVAQSLSNVSGSCSEQSGAVGNAAGETEVFSSHVDNFSTAISDTRQQVKATNLKASQGKKDISDAIRQMYAIEETVSNTAVVVEELGEQVKNIGSIADTIADIASQTNLLSLNASIEAARAGDAGKGFAVVAGEVRVLADQSNEAASKINELIHSIQNKSGEAVNSMQSGLESVKAGAKVVNNAGTTFDEIVAMVSEISDRSVTMEQLIKVLNEGTQNLRGSISTIDNMSKNVEYETETVSAASQEQAASMHEIMLGSEKLAETAQLLKEAVAQFEL